MEIFATIVSGVLVFVLGQVFIRFVVEPLQDLKRVIGEIAHALIYYADVYSNPGPTHRDDLVDETRKALRDKAGLLRSRASVVPFYSGFARLRLVSTWRDVKEASSNLIGLSNSLLSGNAEGNSVRRDGIEKALRLDINMERPRVVEKGKEPTSIAIRTFIRFTGLALTFEAALFLAKGNLFLSAQNIALLAATRIGYNPELVESLAQQNADTWVGVILLLVAFVLQTWVALWAFRYGDFSTHRGGVVSALVFSIVLAIGAFYFSKHLATSTAQEVKANLTARGIAG